MFGRLRPHLGFGTVAESLGSRIDAVGGLAGKEPGPRHTRVLKGAAAATGLAVLVLGLAPEAQARTRCFFSDARNLLTVTAANDALGEIRRNGQEIAVGEFLGSRRPCRGGTPTVFNTDTIKVVIRDFSSFVDLRLDGGPFAPGATPEATGAAEIEVRFGGSDPLALVSGTPGADEFRWGPGGGLNVNPRSNGDQDVDVTARGVLAFVVAFGAAGNDRILPGPGPAARFGIFSVGGAGNDLLVAPPTGGIMEGGKGNDRLLGRQGSDLLIGSRGRDRLSGARGRDGLHGGAGRDLLAAGPGRDVLNSRDRRRERVMCGSGRDRVKSDRRDRLRGCEVIRKPQGRAARQVQHHLGPRFLPSARGTGWTRRARTAVLVAARQQADRWRR